MTPDHPSWIAVPSPNRSPRDPKWPVTGVVLHFTAAGSGKGTAEYFAKREVSWKEKDPVTGKEVVKTAKVSASAHLTVDRDGTVYQSVAFSDQAWHAGPAKLWKGGATPTNVNKFTIGIEIANWGEIFRDKGGGWVTYLKRPFKGGVPFMDKNGRFWEQYPPEQVAAVIQVTKVILSKYPHITREDITGHEHIQSNKSDPGPAWPWAKYFDALFGDEEEEALITASEDDDRKGDPVVEDTPSLAVDPPPPPAQATEIGGSVSALTPVKPTAPLSGLATLIAWLVALFSRKPK